MNIHQHQAAAKLTPKEFETVEKLVKAGYYLNVSDFVRSAVRDKINETKRRKPIKKPLRQKKFTIIEMVAIAMVAAVLAGGIVYVRWTLVGVAVSPWTQPRGPGGSSPLDLSLGTPVMYGDIEVIVENYKFVENVVIMEAGLAEVVEDGGVMGENEWAVESESEYPGTEFLMVYVKSTNNGSEKAEEMWSYVYGWVFYDGHKLENQAIYISWALKENGYPCEPDECLFLKQATCQTCPGGYGYTIEEREVAPGESVEGWTLIRVPKGLDRSKIRLASVPVWGNAPGTAYENLDLMVGLATWKLE
jgi:Arc/MetJ-type ribon-helix-helix transcriptional regulator